MKNTIQSLLVALLILSTESKSMEVSMDLEPRNCQCVCDSHPPLREPVDKESLYFPLIEADNSENKRICFQIQLKMDAPHHRMLKLSETFYVTFFTPIAHIYLKINEMALKSIENMTNGTLPEGIKIIESKIDGEPEFHTNEGRYIGDVDKGLEFYQIKTLHEGMSVVAFGEELPSVMQLSLQSMGRGSIRMGSPHNFVEEDI